MANAMDRLQAASERNSPDQFAGFVDALNRVQAVIEFNLDGTIIAARTMYSIPALENSSSSKVLVFERDGVEAVQINGNDGRSQSLPILTVKSIAARVKQSVPFLERDHASKSRIAISKSLLI